MDQVDAVLENFAVHDDAKLLQLADIIIESTMGKVDVAHALHMHDHLLDTGAMDAGPDRMQCLHAYFHDWIELELAKRYAWSCIGVSQDLGTVSDGHERLGFLVSSHKESLAFVTTWFGGFAKWLISPTVL